MTPEELRIHLSYDAATGLFTRRNRPGTVGRVATKGYLQIFVCGKRHMAHRLAWFYVNGEWPQNQLDHINQNKLDNRITNLRIVDNKQNQENVTVWSHNTSGRRGVFWIKASGKYRAEIKHNKVSIHLGIFDNIIDAVAARIRAERELFTHSSHYAKITHADVFQRDFEPGPGHQVLQSK